MGASPSKKTGKNAPIVVQNAWAALQEDTTSEEEEEEEEQEEEDKDNDDDENEEGEQDAQDESQPEPYPEQGEDHLAETLVPIGRSDDPKVQQLMDLGASSKEARDLLEQTGGDVEAAAEAFFGSWEDRLAKLGTWAESSDD
eukprot:COSAG02_NODE_5131_length_4604_cov_6.767592_5_plen_142_part_00